MQSDKVTLASGHEMPLIGFGLWKVPADKAADTVYNVSKPSPTDFKVLGTDTPGPSLGDQGWIPSVRRCIRLPERKRGRRWHSTGYYRRAGEARGDLRDDETLEQLSPEGARSCHGQGTERRLGARIFGFVPDPFPSGVEVHRPRRAALSCQFLHLVLHLVLSEYGFPSYIVADIKVSGVVDGRRA